jgi:hypothetical protein
MRKAAVSWNRRKVSPYAMWVFWERWTNSRPRVQKSTGSPVAQITCVTWTYPSSRRARPDPRHSHSKTAALFDDGVDVYDLDPSLLLELEKSTCSAQKLLSCSKFDFLVAPYTWILPIQCLQSQRKEKIFHHEIVGKILIDDSRLSGIKGRGHNSDIL